MASAGLCFSLSLAPCENQIVLCLKREGEKGFAYTPIFWGKSGCVLKREKKVFSDSILNVIVEEANYWKEC